MAADKPSGCRLGERNFNQREEGEEDQGSADQASGRVECDVLDLPGVARHACTGARVHRASVRVRCMCATCGVDEPLVSVVQGAGGSILRVQ